MCLVNNKFVILGFIMPLGLQINPSERGRAGERGLSEYTNKLVRQYIPKKLIFNQYNDNEIKDIQFKINRRPRKKLNYDNPKNIFYKFANKKVAFAS